MATDTELKLRGLVLSASELQQLTGWPDALIEDYLNILRNLVILSNEIDVKNDILKTTTIVNTTPYTPLATDEEIFVDTDSIPITITLPEGIDGTNYRIINVGTSGNNMTITPFGTELLGGDNDSEDFVDGEVVVLTFETDEGWY